MNATHSLMEQENNRRAEELSHKVSILKSYAKDIEEESKSQNLFLDQMQNSFQTAGDLLSGTLYRVMGIPKNRPQNRKIMCYVIVFIIFSLLVCYYLIFHRFR